MAGRESSLRIELLGALHVERFGRHVTGDLPGLQGRALLAYLVLHRGDAIDRADLIRALWPTSAPADPRSALTSVLAKVRRAVGPEHITGRTAVRFTPPPDAELDVQQVTEGVDRAERAIAHQDPQTAIHAARDTLAILGRPLLPGLNAAWLEPWHAAFAEWERRGLEAMAQAGLALGGEHLGAAERAARAALESDQYRESAYALLMQIQAARGDAAEALRTFDRLRVLLREELGISPSPALIELHGSLLGHGAPAPAAAPPLPALQPLIAVESGKPFVGREAVLQRLHAAWSRCDALQPRLVLLVGEDGVGKTSVATHFAADVHDAGGLVCYGRADEDALLPHQPFVEALRSLHDHLGDAIGSDGPIDRDILSRLIRDVSPPREPRDIIDRDGHELLRFQLFAAVVDRLDRATRTRPVLLVLEDLHWADKSTLLMLQHILRQPQLTQMLVICTFRDGEVGPDHPLAHLLANLRRERRVERIRVGGLDEHTTRALVGARLGRDATPGFVARLHRQTEGNAFFIEETLRALVDSDLAVHQTATEEDLEHLGVPEGVAEVIGRRVTRLSPLAGDVLRAASVVGRSFAIGVLEQIVGGTTDEVISAIEASIAAGLVVEVADDIDVFRFAHALVREVLCDELTSSRRVRLHHRIAVALERLAEHQPVNPAMLAHHFELARHISGSEPARRWAILAGRRAAELLAYEEAAEHLERALSLFDGEDGAERFEVLLALGRVQWHAGDERARETLLAAADSASRRGAADELARAALAVGERWFEALFVGPRYRNLMQEALRALGPADSPLRALLLARVAEHMGFPAEHQLALEMSDEALQMAHRLGDEDILVATTLARQVVLCDARHLDERLALSVRLPARACRHRELLAEHHHWRLSSLLTVGNLDAAREEQRELDRISAELRQPLLLSLAAGWRGVWAELAGKTELAESCAEICLEHARAAHLKDAISTWTVRLIAIRRRQGRLGELTTIVEQLARDDGGGTGWPSVLALIHAESCDLEIARAIYERELAAGVGGIPRGMRWLAVVVLLSELCVKLRDVARGRELYELLTPYARHNVVIGYSSCWGPVEGYLASLARLLGDNAGAAAHLRAALVRAQALEAPLLVEALQRGFGA